MYFDTLTLTTSPLQDALFDIWSYTEKCHSYGVADALCPRSPISPAGCVVLIPGTRYVHQNKLGVAGTRCPPSPTPYILQGTFSDIK